MSVGVMGAFAGLLLAAAEFLFLRKLATRVALPETRRVLNITGIVQFVLLPVVGWLVAPLVVGD